MKSLTAFLNPKRKPNLKFILSDAFQDEKGNPILWEMRQLTAAEGMEMQKELQSKEYMDIMLAYVANSLVYPDLRDAELLKGLSQREGRSILSPTEALRVMVTDAELAKLVDEYTRFNDLTGDFSKKAEEAKN